MSEQEGHDQVFQPLTPVSMKLTACKAAFRKRLGGPSEQVKQEPEVHPCNEAVC